VLTQSERESYGHLLAARDGGYICFYCKEDLTSDFHIDHKVPIAKGGVIASKTSRSPACPAIRRSMRRTLTNIESGEGPDVFLYQSGAGASWQQFVGFDG